MPTHQDGHEQPSFSESADYAPASYPSSSAVQRAVQSAHKGKRHALSPEATAAGGTDVSAGRWGVDVERENLTREERYTVDMSMLPNE